MCLCRCVSEMSGLLKKKNGIEKIQMAVVRRASHLRSELEYLSLGLLKTSYASLTILFFF